MRRIAPHLSLASRAIVSNVWLLETRDGRFLVDSGVAFERPLLRRQLAAAGVRGTGDLTAVLLTHRHSDHAGNAAWLRKTFDCPVCCHRHDAACLRGACAPVRLGGRGRGRLYEEVLCAVEDLAPARCDIDEVFDEGPWKWGFHVVPTPGHTEGSVMLWHEPTRTLFSGDAILAGPLRWIERLALAVDGFSLDVDACHAAVQRYLRDLPPVGVLASGHGPAVTRDPADKLLALRA
jgi:glyoxylase-like metal-dependent hydrolase (beta-lactamase superfamily II)